jgi:hypothetical protein
MSVAIAEALAERDRARRSAERLHYDAIRQDEADWVQQRRREQREERARLEDERVARDTRLCGQRIHRAGWVLCPYLVSSPGRQSVPDVWKRRAEARSSLTRVSRKKRVHRENA